LKNTLIINNIIVDIYGDYNNKDLPVIFFFHGFTSNKENGPMGRCEQLEKLGFIVLCFDAYKHGSRDDGFLPLSKKERYFEIIEIVIQTARDAKMIFEYLFKYKNEYFTYGVSMGSQISFYLGTIDLKCRNMVCLVGSPSFVEYFKQRNSLYNFDKAEFENRIEKYKTLDPLINYQRLSDVNILLLLGDNDDVVSPIWSKELHSKLPNSTILKTFDTNHNSTPDMLKTAYDYLTDKIKYSSYIYDCVVVGGSLSGVQSAIALKKKGSKVALISKYKWIGGQLTSQGIPLDEHPFIESEGGTKSYMEFREYIRSLYVSYSLYSREVIKDKYFNPGSGWVSHLSFLPQLAYNKFISDLKGVDIFNEYNIECVNSEIDIVKNLFITSRNNRVNIIGSYYIDATEDGLFSYLAGLEMNVGAEGKDETNEEHAGDKCEKDIQPITFSAAITNNEDNFKLIDKPKYYDYFKDYKVPWGDSTLSLITYSVNSNKSRNLCIFKEFGAKNDLTNPELFSYRMIQNKDYYSDKRSDITILNWPQNDYIMDNIYDTDTDKLNIELSKELTLSLVYYLQNDLNYKGIQFVPNILGTEDGFAQAPYIRESRRIKALYTIKEESISIKGNNGTFFDSVGIGYYNIDIHMTTRLRKHFFEPCLPFEIPLGAFIPIKFKNVIGSCKNIGTTHITNGCYRLHPVEWNIGEVAGYFISYCLKNNIDPHKVYKDINKIKEFQNILINEGIKLHWSKEIMNKFKEEV
jgi:pimeloyl-ACP methyl ester carboxylesterase